LDKIGLVQWLVNESKLSVPGQYNVKVQRCSRTDPQRPRQFVDGVSQNGLGSHWDLLPVLNITVEDVVKDFYRKLGFVRRRIVTRVETPSHTHPSVP
jgi:hypothetical protein